MQVVICQQRFVEKEMSEGDMDQLKSMSPMVSISIISNINIIQQQYYTFFTSMLNKKAIVLRVFALPTTSKRATIAHRGKTSMKRRHGLIENVCQRGSVYIVRHNFRQRFVEKNKSQGGTGTVLA